MEEIDIFGKIKVKYKEVFDSFEISYNKIKGANMQLSIDISDELFLSINESKQNLVQIAKQKLALELYKSHKISISQGAKFLDMDIYSFMKLLNQYEIPAIDDYDIKAELDALR